MQELKGSGHYNKKIFTFSNLVGVASATVPYLTKGRVGLSGGSTYSKLFSYWRKLNPDIRGATFFPVDERLVPFKNPNSNWREAFNKFLKPLGKLRADAHFASSLQKYKEILFTHFNGQFPIFDTIFLGVGNDGHTASLFPDGNYYGPNNPTILETIAPNYPHNRISLSPRVIQEAYKVIVIIYGSDKKEITERVLSNDISLPIVKVLNNRDESLLFVEDKYVFKGSVKKS